mmetsp:Transcript_8532/g.25073  ORF Transcript_8532/g.25073 Transcript_8532/m.25073 type:complete len:221 (+) Transcript_8532:1256-1918(+)
MWGSGESRWSGLAVLASPLVNSATVAHVAPAGVAAAPADARAPFSCASSALRGNWMEQVCAAASGARGAGAKTIVDVGGLFAAVGMVGVEDENEKPMDDRRGLGRVTGDAPGMFDPPPHVPASASPNILTLVCSSAHTGLSCGADCDLDIPLSLPLNPASGTSVVPVQDVPHAGHARPRRRRAQCLQSSCAHGTSRAHLRPRLWQTRHCAASLSMLCPGT